ncbi:unnamed protein product [Orchesella dallaii]|uniref:Phosphatidylethanolamine-binding protein n=1 Tax=Orchesella dallaii TaxID=48710 RepID=A0ABP1S4M1_9HEXA
MELKGVAKTCCVTFFVLAIVDWNNFVTAANPGMEAMVKEEVVPDVLDAVPKAVLGLKYGTIEVKLGNMLTPTQVKTPPTVTWNADSNKFYLLCMTEPDAPSRKDHSIAEWHHWLVGNIPGTDISKGETLSEYIGSGPAQGGGANRYVFLLYEQPGKLTFDEKHLTNRSAEGRAKFSARNFAKKYKLGEPIAGNFYQAEWDDYVPTVYKQLNL